MEGEGLRVGGPAEWTRRTFRCPASPTHKKETCRGVVKRHPLFLDEVVKRNPVTHSQQKSRSMNGRRLCATLFGPPSPRRPLRPTREAYPKQRRVSKSPRQCRGLVIIFVASRKWSEWVVRTVRRSRMPARVRVAVRQAWPAPDSHRCPSLNAGAGSAQR